MNDAKRMVKNWYGARIFVSLLDTGSIAGKGVCEQTTCLPSNIVEDIRVDCIVPFEIEQKVEEDLK
jgi:hypothetical protein